LRVSIALVPQVIPLFVMAIVHLPSGFILARPVARKLTLWLSSLAALATVYVGLWIWIARSASLRTPYAKTQLLLSGVYVCGSFRWMRLPECLASFFTNGCRFARPTFTRVGRLFHLVVIHNP
jgi:hypothetical protein